MQVWFVTGNANKVKEVNAMLGADGEGVPRGQPLRHFDANLQEIQGTPEEIVTRKCQLAAARLRAFLGPGHPFWVVVEDTSLAFRALDDMMGPYVKWFGSPETLASMLAPGATRAAVASCIFAAAGVRGDDGEDAASNVTPLLFHGEVHGEIVAPRAGPEAPFDWDTIFKPEGLELTYAQMGQDAKNAISHRRKALNALRAWLTSVTPPLDPLGDGER